MWTKNELNEKFAAGDTVLIPKKGNPNYLKNYRPISLLNHSFKATTKIINNRLKKLVKKSLLIYQNGFRPKVGTRDALFALQETLKNVVEYNLQCVIAFTDFSKAFDSIARDWMLLSLREHKVPEEIIKIIERIYEKANIRIKCYGNNQTHRSKKIYVKNGVLQGDVLSPTLFIIALDSILRRIPQKWRTFILHTLG